MALTSDRPARRGTSGDGPPAEVLDVVTGCPLPCLLLHVPSGQIQAASPVAEHLLCPDGGSLVGRSFEDFTADQPTGALELIVAGSLDGYEGRRSVRRGRRAVPMTVWIRGVGGREGRTFALVKLLPDPSTLGEALERPEGTNAESVVGSTDVHLVVDRISADVAGLLEHRATDVVGQSLLRLVHPEDVAPVLKSVAWSIETGMGSSLEVRAELFGLRASRCQLVLLPMEPSPSFAFALLDEESTDALASDAGMQLALWQFDHVLRSAAMSRMAGALPPSVGLGQLSARELEIVVRLANGDRVPAIARALFLSPSTVRNHLSNVFRKLRVGSQQELIDLLRRTDGPPRSS